MAIATRPEKQVPLTPFETTRSRLTSDLVWQQLDRASFAVIGYVTPAGESRSSGVVYKTVGKRIYIAVAPDSWKARHIASGKHVSVTVPVRRGGILALVVPIPPATISFRATAIVHPAGSVKIGSLSKQLESLLPPERRDAAVVIELIPEGDFLAYGVGVPLMDMQKPQLARAVVPVETKMEPESGYGQSEKRGSAPVGNRPPTVPKPLRDGWNGEPREDRASPNQASVGLPDADWCRRSLSRPLSNKSSANSNSN